jgi:hypothetical protein
MELALDALVDRLAAVDPSELGQVEAQDLIVQLHGAIGRLTGLRDALLGDLHARGQGQVLANPESQGPALYRTLQGWWRDTARLTGQQAGSDVRRCVVLRELPVVRDAVIEGDLQPAQAAVLTRLHGRIDDAGLHESQAHLVTVAAPLDTLALSRMVAHLIATHCEPVLDSDDRAAHEKRYLQLRQETDGTVRGRFVLSAEQAEVVQTVLEPLARQQGTEDRRSAGQRRADALVDVFEGAARWMDLPEAGGQRPQLSYVVSADWAARDLPPSLPEQLAALMAEHGAHPLGLGRYAPEAAWTGPQTRARIESVLCDARISRVLLDKDCKVISLQAVTDAVTPAHRRAVSARDRCCVAKGCTRPPAFCDVHHLIHREHGGGHDTDNLVLLCRRHHVLWHKGLVGWRDLHLPWLPDPDDLEHPRHQNGPPEHQAA